MTVTVDDNKPTRFQPKSLQKIFKLDQQSMLYIGKTTDPIIISVSEHLLYSPTGVPNEATDPQLSTLPCCLHQVVINGRYVMLPSGATESRNLGACAASSASSCSENYCGAGGICYKTIDCDKPLTGVYMVVNSSFS